MKHRFKKAMFRYLLEIVSDGDATGRIIHDLSRQTSNASVQYQLCESAVKKLYGKIYLNHRESDKIIDFIFKAYKKVSVYDGQTAEKILNLIMTDAIVGRYYSEIAEAYVYILDDRMRAEDILKRAYSLLQDDIQSRTKHTLISESGRDGISKDESYTCSTMDFIRLSYCWINTAHDKSYAVTIANFGSQYAQGFYENLELGEFFIRFPEERCSALKHFRKAEEQAKDFDDCCCLFHDLTLLVKNIAWTRQIFDRCRTMAKTADDFTRLGEILGNKNGMPNMELCREMFAMAMQLATNDEERKCVQDSWENVQEEYEQE